MRGVVARRNQNYQYQDTLGQEGAPHVEVRSGDIFFGLDLAAHLVPGRINQLMKWKLTGARLHFVVYDILPLTHPIYFTSPRIRHFRRWIRLLSIMADSLLCISNSVQTDVQSWLKINVGLPASELHTTVIPLGSNLPPENLRQLPSNSVIETLEKLKNRSWVLMVGTLEPRKCHAKVLDAFEKLWLHDAKLALVLVARRGWQTKLLQDRIKQHAQLNQSLFWFQDATDAELDLFYQKTSGVLAASIAEGYGLPLTEALDHQKSLLVRDIPVFRETAGTAAFYFTDDTPDALSYTLQHWLSNTECILRHSKKSVNTCSWADATTCMVQALGIVKAPPIARSNYS